jgi:mannosyl-oligosaccharide alpha-1,2-mannosidase
MLLGGLSTQPRKLYEAAIEAAKQLLFFRPMTQDGRDILLSGNAKVEGPKKFTLEAQGQHLTCFIGGMMAIASQIFSRPDDLLVARKIVNGCIWAYDIMPTGIMPEAFHAVPCDDPEKCSWDPAAWHNGIMRKHNNVNQKNMEEMIESLRLPPGIIDISDRRYLLR